MKQLFYWILCLTLVAGCSKDDSDYKTSDFAPAFAKVLQEKGYISDCTKITYDEVKDIDSLDVSFNGLTSLAGIEYFESLTYLNNLLHWM